MKKLKKLVSILLLFGIIIISYYNIYAEDSALEPAQSTSENNIHFAEKNHILYYFNMIENEQRDKMRLYQYDVNTEKEILLCEECFKMCSDIRVCDDGYVYFRGIKQNDNTIKVYRVSISGGKSECICDDVEKIIFLSDTWIYHTNENTFHNLVTNEIIQNTITENIFSDFVSSMLEYKETVYFYTHANYGDDLPNEVVKFKYKNGQKVKNGFYALPLYQQNKFYKINLDSLNSFDFYRDFYFYNDNLYYLCGNTVEQIHNGWLKNTVCMIKKYSLQHGTSEVILVEKEAENIDFIGIYNNILYYHSFVIGGDEVCAKLYRNIYGIFLNNENSQSFVVLPYAIGFYHHVLEDVICYSNEADGKWKIFNYKTKQFCNITPY